MLSVLEHIPRRTKINICIIGVIRIYMEGYALYRTEAFTQYSGHTLSGFSVY